MLTPLPSENCKASTMNLKVKYLFPSSSSGANFCIYQLPECLGMRKKILAHGIMMQKKPQTRVDILWIFTDFHRVLRVQSPSCTPHGNFSNGISPLTVKLSIKFQKICEPPPHLLRFYYFDSPNF